ncbi:MAG TPA: Rne/Rng family ribonuclease [Actinomycetes bacterium]
MLDTEPTENDPTASDAPETSPTASAPRRRRAASRPAGPPSHDAAEAAPGPEPPAEPAPAKKATRKRTSKKAAAAEAAAEAGAIPDLEVGEVAAAAPAKKATRKRTSKKAAAPEAASAEATPEAATAPAEAGTGETPTAAEAPALAFGAPGVLFQPPQPTAAPTRRRAAAKAAAPEEPLEEESADTEAGRADEEGAGGGRRRRRGGRGRRGRGRGADEAAETAETAETAEGQAETSQETAEEAVEVPEGEELAEGTTRRRRRRRRRGGEGETEEVSDESVIVVTRVREPRKRSRADRSDEEDGVKSVKGSTRLEAKKQRRREGREAGRRRPSIITEAEFLARRESVDRVMVVRQKGERTQIAVLEDGVLVEHYVSTASSSGLVGNVYLGKVQNVLPSMEAAFVDIGKGRNAVLYAGEVNWDAAGLDGQPRRIELALKSGDPVLVQVTKDPIGHKGARLTSQVSLAGRYLVLVPGGSMTGISRKLPDTERSRLKAILKKVVPEGAGVIVRTAAEGASEEELARDVARLTAQWEDIEKKSAKGTSAPTLLYGEPDMTIRVVRDIFNEDFSSLVVSGDDAWDMLEPYVSHVAPDLRDRLSRWTDEQDVFPAHRVDEQLAKALDRKVWLPSGGYLIIDRTEAMVVVDVNTGKFTGQGGNLEETVTKNNLEAAEEIVRQLRLRDLGGIIVIDFIDMVLESNRDLVLRRLMECLGRDRTKHQVAEVTSLGLVQMTRKRVGQGLHEAFSETCEVCNGRGYHIRTEPVESRGGSGNGSGDRRGSRAAAKPSKGAKKAAKAAEPTPDGLPDGGGAAEVTTPDGPRETSPVAVEDPVEAASSGADRTGPAPAAGDEPPPKRKRRRAVSPVTTV